jgi:hypothetical protein
MQWLMKNVGVSGAHGFPFPALRMARRIRGGRKIACPIALFFYFLLLESSAQELC